MLASLGGLVSYAAKVHFKEQVYDMKSLTLFNQPIRVAEDGIICLTDMWKASGKSESESPVPLPPNQPTQRVSSQAGENRRLRGFSRALYTVEHMAGSLLLMIMQHG